MKTDTHSSHIELKILSAAILTLIILALGGFAYYARNENSKLQAELTQKNGEIATLTTRLQESQKKTASREITAALPNGKTASYPDTNGNRNILFWSAGSDMASTNFILLSHKSIQQFLSGVSSDTIVKLCGTDTNIKALKYNISVGIFNTNNKTLGKPQNNSCLDELASSRNTDTALRAKAQAVIDQVNGDVDAFIKSVAIK